MSYFFAPRTLVLALSAAATLFVTDLQAQTPAPALPDPATTTVGALGWMQGFPPAADKQITFENPASNVYPRTRWVFSHVRELVPTANVWRGGGAPSPLPAAPRDLDGIAFKSMTGEQLNFGQMLTRTYTDGILVMHRG